MRELLAVGIGGFLGAVARYAVSGWVHRLTGPAFPWGTLTVNLAGCLASRRRPAPRPPPDAKTPAAETAGVRSPAGRAGRRHHAGVTDR